MIELPPLFGQSQRATQSSQDVVDGRRRVLRKTRGKLGGALVVDLVHLDYAAGVRAALAEKAGAARTAE